MIITDNGEDSSLLEIISSQGYSSLCDHFLGSQDLEDMREVIFSYLKSYLNFNSDDLPLSTKISSHIRSEEIPENLLEQMRNDVIPLVKSFANKDSVKKIFSSVFGHDSISVCEHFLDFRVNIPNIRKVPTGWHQDAETPFIYGHEYWKYFSLASDLF